MKAPWFTLLTLSLLLTTLARGEEAIPQEKVREMASKALGELPALEAGPFPFEGDTDKAQLAIHEGVGVMVIPAKGLTAEKIQGVTGTPLPVGQLWLRLLNVTDGGKALLPDKVRTTMVQAGDEPMKVAVYLLGVVKNSQGARELVLYGKDAQPLVNFPLATVQGTQTFPIELGGQQTSSTTGTLTLKVLGQFSADIAVTRGGS